MGTDVKQLALWAGGQSITPSSPSAPHGHLPDLTRTRQAASRNSHPTESCTPARHTLQRLHARAPQERPAIPIPCYEPRRSPQPTLRTTDRASCRQDAGIALPSSLCDLGVFSPPFPPWLCWCLPADWSCHYQLNKSLARVLLNHCLRGNKPVKVEESRAFPRLRHAAGALAHIPGLPALRKCLDSLEQITHL